MSGAVSVYLSHGGKGYDITRLCGSITCAGSVEKVGRTLDLTLLSPRYDKNQPTAPVALGDNVQLFVGGTMWFDGFVFDLRRDSGDDLIDLGCVDRGLYLKQNQGCYRFTGQTPESITRQVCRDYGITVGELAETGVTVRRSFSGSSLYQIIQTAYTLAAERTGERYVLRFRGAVLDVIRRARDTATAVIAPGSNLLSATVRENAENLVSEVGIYSESGSLIRVRRNEEAVALCGVMRRYLQAAQDRDVDAQADTLLEDYDVQRTITVEVLEPEGLFAGGSVIAREPVTGLSGLYWIDSDSHTWKGGIHRAKLGLSLKKIMDKTTAGEELT